MKILELAKTYERTAHDTTIYRDADVVVYWHAPSGLVSFVDAEEGLVIFGERIIRNRGKAMAYATETMRARRTSITL